MVPLLMLLGLSQSAAVPLMQSMPTVTPPSLWKQLSWSTVHAGEALDISGMSKTFNDDFTSCSTIGVETNASNPGYKWWSFSKVNGGSDGTWAGVTFLPITAKPSPFDCSSGHLQIAISNPTGTAWQSGQIEAQNKAQEGFQQTYGYFSFTARMPTPPSGLVPWVAFWFRSANAVGPGKQFNEPDLIETGLASRTNLTLQRSTFNMWPASLPLNNQIRITRNKQLQFTYNTFDGVYHEYGMLVRPGTVIVYIDRTEIGRLPMGGLDMAHPLYPMIDAAIYYRPTAPTSTVYKFDVSNVAAYSCGASPSC